MHEECNINHYKMPGKYYIFMIDCQKESLIISNWLRGHRRISFDLSELYHIPLLSLCLFCGISFFLLFNTLPVSFPQQVSVFFQMAFQHTFPGSYLLSNDWHMGDRWYKWPAIYLLDWWRKLSGTWQHWPGALWQNWLLGRSDNDWK